MDAPGSTSSQGIYHPPGVFAERIPRIPMQRGLGIPKGTIKIRSDLLPFVRRFENEERKKLELQHRLDLKRRQPLFMICPSDQSLRYAHRVARNNPYGRQRVRQPPSRLNNDHQRGPNKQQHHYLNIMYGNGFVGQWNEAVERQYSSTSSSQYHGYVEQQLPYSNGVYYQGHPAQWSESVQQQPIYLHNTHGQGFIGQQQTPYSNGTQLYGSIKQGNGTTDQVFPHIHDTNEDKFTKQGRESIDPQPSNVNGTTELDSIGQWYAALVKWCEFPEEWEESVEQQHSQPESVHSTKESSTTSLNSGSVSFLSREELDSTITSNNLFSSDQEGTFR